MTGHNLLEALIHDGRLAVHDQAGACAGGREGCRPTNQG